jgi:hypothetical protein
MYILARGGNTFSSGGDLAIIVIAVICFIGCVALVARSKRRK